MNKFRNYLLIILINCFDVEELKEIEERKYIAPSEILDMLQQLRVDQLT